jgi:ABC-type cobalamin/Fe3+-siderophores transport system ATPase subunit
MHRLSVSLLDAWYGRTQVLNGITLSVCSGELLCLTGPNGGGKSTLLAVMAGIVPEGLRIKTENGCGIPVFDGKRLDGYSRKQISSHIAFMTQDETIAWNYPVRDVVLTGRYSHTGSGSGYTVCDYETVNRVLSELGISGLADRPVHSLSGGEFRKVRIARALAQEPEILLLDEPAANLDFGYQQILMRMITDMAHNMGTGIIASIHDLNLAACFADRIALLPLQGSCLAGSVREVLTPGNLEAVYGTKMGVFNHPVFGCPQVYWMGQH